MTAPELLAAARAHGVEMLVLDGELELRAPAAPPAAFLAAVRERKRELLELLRHDADPLDGPVTAEHVQPVAWRLYSRALGCELWLARDLAAADELWAASRLPALTLDEAARLHRLPLELWRAVLNARAVFGPSAVALGDVSREPRDRGARA